MYIRKIDQKFTKNTWNLKKRGIINKCFAFKFPRGKVFSDIYNSSPENIWFRNSNFKREEETLKNSTKTFGFPLYVYWNILHIYVSKLVMSIMTIVMKNLLLSIKDFLPWIKLKFKQRETRNYEKLHYNVRILFHN